MGAAPPMSSFIRPFNLGAQALADRLWRQLAVGSLRLPILGGPCCRGTGLTQPHSDSRGGVVHLVQLLPALQHRTQQLCIPDYVGMQHTVLEELHTTQLGGHFGCECTLALARRSV